LLGSFGRGWNSVQQGAVVIPRTSKIERLSENLAIFDFRLTAEEMAVYRRPYQEPGESRRPTLTWPREIPVGGEPADVVAIVDSYARWLMGSAVPKLFVNADPGIILTGAQREFCRRWPNQQEITVRGSHFIQEDAPAEIGQAVALFVTRTRT